MRSALTDDEGRFLFRPRGLGVFSVRAEMIGRKSQVSAPVRVRGPGSHSVTLRLPVSAIAIPGIRVEADKECVLRPQEGLEVARVWGEAKLALRIQEWTQQEGLYRFRVEAYERDLDPNTLAVGAENRRVTRGVARNPIVSLPAEDLMAGGFMRPAKGGGYAYFAPDANVLLSDEFLDSHCFRLTSREDRPDALGLAFEPVHRSGQSDIAGTFWLHQKTAHLQFLEFSYTGLPWKEAEGAARGRVVFEALPNGAWIVRRWWIRMPEMVQDLNLARGRDSGIRIRALKEFGGGVTRIEDVQQGVISRTEPGVVTGVVWDSTRSAPLPGAFVFLSGTQYSTHSDSSGQFQLGGLPEGLFRAAFSHPRLDTLGTFSRAVEVEVTAGETTEVQLHAPSIGSHLAAQCPPDVVEEGPTSVVVGRVRAAGTWEPLVDARVTVEWYRYGLASWGSSRAPRSRFGGGVRERIYIEEDRIWIETSPDSTGHFTFCEVPAGWLLIAQAHVGNRSSDTLHVRAPVDGYALIDLEIDPAKRELSLRRDNWVPGSDDGRQGSALPPWRALVEATRLCRSERRSGCRLKL